MCELFHKLPKRSILNITKNIEITRKFLTRMELEPIKVLVVALENWEQLTETFHRKTFFVWF